MRFEDNVIQADTIEIDLPTNRITAEGSLTWDNDEYHAVGSRMEFDITTKEGTVDDVTLTVGPWICSGEKVVQPERNVALVRPALLTTCDLKDPHYSIKCKRLRIRLGKDLTATQVTFLVGSTPVFWLPAMVTPIREFRLPFEAQVGQTNELGAFVRTSPSFRLGPHLPGQVHLDHFQRKGWGYGLTQDLLDGKGARIIRGHGYWIREHTQTRPGTPEERWQVFAEGAYGVGTTTQMSTRVAYVSDAYFRELYGIRRLNLMTTAGQRTASFTAAQRLPGASATIRLERTATQTLYPPNLQPWQTQSDVARYTLSSVHAPQVSVSGDPIPLVRWLNLRASADADRMYTWQNDWYVNSAGISPTLEAFGRLPGLGGINIRPGLKADWRDRGDRILLTAPNGATEFVEDNRRGGVYRAVAASSLKPPVPLGLSLDLTHYVAQRLNKRIGMDPLDQLYRGLEQHNLGGRLSSPIGRLGSASLSTGYDLRNKQDPWQFRWSPLVPQVTLKPHANLTTTAEAKYDMWHPLWRRYVREVSGSVGYRREDDRLSAALRPRYLNNELGLPKATTTGQAYRMSQHVYGPSFQDASLYPYFLLLDGDVTVPITARIDVTANGQYDFAHARFAFYTLSVTRNLHCWEMTGTFQQYASGEFQFYVTMGLRAFPSEGIPLFRL